MVELLPLAEIEFRIALLPPISRGAHLGGPLLHAQRLIGLWAVGEREDVPLAQAFRLLDANVVAGVILRTTMATDYPRDPRYWTFAPLADMLGELRACAWQAACDGALLVEGIRGMRGTQHQQILPVELPRLAPDFRLSRLVKCDGCDACDGQIGKGGVEAV
jgi:hypothetical protein